MTTTTERPEQTTDSDRAALYDALADALREGNVRSGDWHKVAERYAKPHFSDGDQLEAARVDAAAQGLLESEAVSKRGPGYLALGPAPAGAAATPDSVPAPGPRSSHSRKSRAAAPAGDPVTSAAPPAKKAATGRVRAKATAGPRKRTPARPTGPRAAKRVSPAPAAATEMPVPAEPDPTEVATADETLDTVAAVTDTGGEQPASAPVDTVEIPAQRRQPLAEAFTAFHQQLTTELGELSELAHQIDDLVDEYSRRSSALRELADVVTDPKLAAWIGDLQPDVPKVVAART